jgi:transposase
MKQHNLPVVIQGLEITSITRVSTNWDISADALPEPICLGCGTRSVSRHSRCEPRFRDLPIQGVPVLLMVQVARWRCRKVHCSLTIFVQKRPDIASVGTRGTRRAAEISTVVLSVSVG